MHGNGTFHPQWTSGAIDFRPGKQDSKSELWVWPEGSHLSYTGPTLPGYLQVTGPCPGLSSE